MLPLDFKQTVLDSFGQISDTRQFRGAVMTHYECDANTRRFCAPHYCFSLRMSADGMPVDGLLDMADDLTFHLHDEGKILTCQWGRDKVPFFVNRQQKTPLYFVAVNLDTLFQLIPSNGREGVRCQGLPEPWRVQPYVLRCGSACKTVLASSDVLALVQRELGEGPKEYLPRSSLAPS